MTQRLFGADFTWLRQGCGRESGQPQATRPGARGEVGLGDRHRRSGDATASRSAGGAQRALRGVPGGLARGPRASKAFMLRHVDRKGLIWKNIKLNIVCI